MNIPKQLRKTSAGASWVCLASRCCSRDCLRLPRPTPAIHSQARALEWGNIDHGLVVGIIVGVAAVAGVGIAYLILHNRGVLVGCIAEAGGRLLADSGKKVYSLLDTGPSLPTGERAKLKGRKSGPASTPSFQVEKVLKDYGHCQP